MSTAKRTWSLFVADHDEAPTTWDAPSLSWKDCSRWLAVVAALWAACSTAAAADSPTVAADAAPSPPTVQKGGTTLAVERVDDLLLTGVGPRVRVDRIQKSGSMLVAVGRTEVLDGVVEEIVATTGAAGPIAIARTNRGPSTVIDLADPVHPRVITRLEPQWPWNTDLRFIQERLPAPRLAARRGIVVIAAGRGYEVFDMADPPAPRKIGDLRIGDTPRGIAFVGDRLFAAVHSRRDAPPGVSVDPVRVVRWRLDERRRLVDERVLHTDPDGTTRIVWTDDRRLWIGRGTEMARMDPDSGAIMYSMNRGVRTFFELPAQGLAVLGEGTVLKLFSGRGSEVTPGTVTLPGTLPVLIDPVPVPGGIAVPISEGGLAVVDFRAFPARLAATMTSKVPFAFRMTLGSSYVRIAGRRAVRDVPIAGGRLGSPSDPLTVTGTIDAFAGNRDVDVVVSSIYRRDGGNDDSVISSQHEQHTVPLEHGRAASDRPRAVGHHQGWGLAQDADVDDARIVIGNDDGVVLFEIADPTRPYALHRAVHINAAAVHLHNDRVVAGTARHDGTPPFLAIYRITEQRRLQQMEIRRWDASIGAIGGVGDLMLVGDDERLTVLRMEPGRIPTPLGHAELPSGPRTMHVDRTVVWLALGPDGVQAIDIGDPAAPERIAAIDTPGSAEQVIPVGPQLYVADGDGGLLVVENPLWTVRARVFLPVAGAR